MLDRPGISTFDGFLMAQLKSNFVGPPCFSRTARSVFMADLRGHGGKMFVGYWRRSKNISSVRDTHQEIPPT